MNINGHYKKKTFWSLIMDGVQLSQGYSHFEEAVYFLPLSSQKCLVFILLTSKDERLTRPWSQSSSFKPLYEKRNDWLLP